MAIPGELIVTDDVPSAFAERAVAAYATRIPDTFSLALSGGSTARRCYETLAAASTGRVDWWKVDVYWSDERCVPHDHEDSNYRLAREALLDRVGAANATHLMRCAEGPDPYQLRLSATSAWAPTATPHRSSPAARCSTPTPAVSSR
jgi:6-phosphogluconolactonase/glucosamine-6-phosphate isomerase/deaminase